MQHIKSPQAKVLLVLKQNPNPRMQTVLRPSPKSQEIKMQNKMLMKLETKTIGNYYDLGVAN